MTHDVSKLPVWARNEIERLRSDLRITQRQLNEAVAGDAMDEEIASNVLLPYFRAEMHSQYLPKNQLVHFLLPHPWAETRPGHIAVRHLRERNAIDIQGSQSIMIEPTASNCCVITFKDK